MTSFKSILTSIHFGWDYYVVYFLFKPEKLFRYHNYMYWKWRDRYCSDEEFNMYLESVDSLD